MLDNYKILTITHHNLNVDEIGNFVVHHEGKEQLKSKLSLLIKNANLEELIYLSTCNRVSFICYSNEEFDIDYIKSFFKYVNPELDEDKLKKISKFVDVYNGSKAVNHLYEVASSMDSLVVGEREIFRQFREAYQQIGAQVQDGSYKPDTSNKHTHIGSIHDLCLAEIRAKFLGA